MDFVARTDELDVIQHAASSPGESALLFCGEHGLGKSRLLREAVARSQIRAVMVAANPAEAAWPLSGFSAVFAALDDPRAVEFGGRFTLASADPRVLFSAARDVLTMLRGLGLPPVLVAIDDVDRMDPVSRTLIGFLAGRLTGTGLRIVATATGIGPDDPLAGFEQHPMVPLTLAASIQVLQHELGAGADAGVVHVLATRSGGNPRVIEQSVSALTPEQAHGHEALVLPLRPPESSWARSIERLAHLTPEAVGLAEDISLAPASILDVLTGDDPQRVDALEDLLYWRIVEVHGRTVRAREPLLRSYLYWHLDSHRRRERHGALAAASADRDPESQVWHLSHASLNGVSGAALLEAAVSLTEKDDVDSAVEFAERAILVGTELTGRHDLLLQFASALSTRGELDLAAHYLRHARIDPPTAVNNLRVASQLIALEFERTRLVSASEVEATVSQFGDHDPDGAVELLSAVSAFHCAKWDLEQARRYHRLAELFLPQARQTRAAAAHESAGLMMQAVDGTPEQRAAGSRTATAALLQLTAPELVRLGSTLSYREHYGQARRVANVVFRTYPGTHLAAGWAWNLAFSNELRAGDFFRARTVVQSWLAEPEERGRSRAAALLAFTWHALAHDRRDEAAGLALQCAERAAAERDAGVLARLNTLLGSDALLRGDHEEALRLLELADAGSAQIENLSLVRHCADLVEAAAAAGRHDEAAEMLERMEAQQSLRPSAWLDQAVARNRALLAPDHLAPELFELALALPNGDYEYARILMAQGERLRRLGLRSEAERATASASALFGKAGATRWAARAASSSPVADTEESDLLGLLNPEELEIVGLVRRGLRNREIAHDLFMSLRTVELRLTTIYRKVGARSRAHLASLLG